jgi:hypothetical protein
MLVLHDEGTMKAKTSRIFKTWIVALEEEFFLFTIISDTGVGIIMLPTQLLPLNNLTI